MLDLFNTNGSSPPKRYRLKVAPWTVVSGQPALSRRLSSSDCIHDHLEKAFDQVHACVARLQTSPARPARNLS